MKNSTDEPVSEYTLKKSHLSWDEIQLIKYFRKYPNKYSEILGQFQKTREQKTK